MDEYEQSYEAALQDENIKMQSGFQNRLICLQDELMKTKKDHLNSYNELKRDFDKEQDKNRLLLKKLSIFMKN